MKHFASIFVVFRSSYPTDLNTSTGGGDVGKYLIYEGDYHNAQQLLTALKRQIPTASQLFQAFDKEKTTRTPSPNTSNKNNNNMAKIWQRHRQHKRYEAEILNSLLLKVDSNRFLEGLRRTPPHLPQILASMFSTDHENGTTNAKHDLKIQESRGDGIATAATSKIGTVVHILATCHNPLLKQLNTTRS